MATIVKQKQAQESMKIKKNTLEIGFLAGLFGCRHKELSRPFTIGKESYRACPNCGARREFDPVSLKTYGHFYFPN